MRVTLKDIAREAKVSICTVSHVLNSTPNYKVKPETRSHVLAVAERLQYQPNLIARGLVKKRSYLVGVIVNRISVSFLPETLQGIQAVADELGYSTMLYTHMWSQERERKDLRALLSKGVDGIIIQPLFPQNIDLLEEAQASVPLVQLYNALPGLDSLSVLADQVKAGRMATEHLIGLGHRRIAHLRGPEEHGAMRFQGYQEALEAHSIPYDPSLVVGDTWEWEEARPLCAALLARSDRPTALVACSDMVAWGAMREALSAGYSVPHDLAIVGVGDSLVAPLMEVPLTTVALPTEEAGRAAMSLLHQQIEGMEAESRVLDVRLVVRSSCGATA